MIAYPLGATVVYRDDSGRAAVYKIRARIWATTEEKGLPHGAYDLIREVDGAVVFAVPAERLQLCGADVISLERRK